MVWKCSRTKYKGDFGVQNVILDLMNKNYIVSVPIGDNAPYDLIIDRNNTLEKIQVKYTESDGIKINCKGTTDNGRRTHVYTRDDIDWIATFDKTTNCCYYINLHLFEKGRHNWCLRIKTTANNQRKKVLWADNFISI